VTNRRTSQRMLQVRFADERAIGVASLAVHDGNEISTTIDVALQNRAYRRVRPNCPDTFT
jgi:hypothetical protein